MPVWRLFGRKRRRYAATSIPWLFLRAALCYDETPAKSASPRCVLSCEFTRVGWVAQLVEQRTENPCVGGSIPPPATTYERPNPKLQDPAKLQTPGTKPCP